MTDFRRQEGNTILLIPSGFELVYVYYFIYMDLYEFIQKFKKKGRQLIMVSSVSSLRVTILLFYKK